MKLDIKPNTAQISFNTVSDAISYFDKIDTTLPKLVRQNPSLLGVNKISLTCQGHTVREISKEAVLLACRIQLEGM